MRSLGLILNPQYDRWFGGYESGFFPAEFSGWREMIEDKENGSAVGVVGNENLPAVFFKNTADNQSVLIVQNSDEKSKARFIQSVLTNGGDISGKSNNEADFSIEISIVEDNSRVAQYLAKRIDEEIIKNGISKGSLKLIADSGKMRTFWQGREITADIGLHTAICSSGYWYDSGKMKWQLDKVSTDKLLIKVDFNPFPAIQTWELFLEDEKTIYWNVTMEISKQVEISERKAGIILNGEYKEWFNSFEQGEFPERFTFWHDIIRNRDGETFGVYPESGLPGVMFSIDDNHLSLIQNTDENIKGRVFQGQVVEIEQTKKYLPQKSLDYFKGKIRLVADKKEIIEHKKIAQPLSYRTESIYLYGDSKVLHNRIARCDEFDAKIKKIKDFIDQGMPVSVVVGISRYNFFKIHEILQFLANHLGKNADFRSFKLSVFPLNKLRRNFIEYLEELKKIAKNILGVEFALVDEELFNIIISIGSQADQGNERQLLRLLGIISEHAFIGPQIVVIDPYHRCNANCIHCWVHTPGVHHSKEYYDTKLDLKKFKSIADDLAELMTDLIIFQGDGEPLMNDEFFDMVRYARGKGIKASFFTNGILLNKDIAKEVIEMGVDEIFCSLPAGTADTFAKINTKQKPEIFLKVLDNLKYLCQLKKKMPVNKPRLIMTHVIHNMNAHELIEMAKNDIAIGADIMRFYLIRLDENIEFLRLNAENVKDVKRSLPQIKEMAKGKSIQLLDTTEFQLSNFEENTGAWSKDVFLNNGCTLGWNFSLIPASGEVSFCCHLRTVGYLEKMSFKQIWDSQEYRQFRYQAKFLKKNAKTKFLNGTTMFDDYCQHCDTHQVIRDVWDQFKLYKLEKFFNET
ncbi:MAG: radical SAM protein [Candidatus Omnitrophica bacterium]|nr:radical SAM protein [Candidatus Omnitrophota bacterium]